MYFFKQNGKQILDLTGDVVITHNDEPIKARTKSAGPSAIKNHVFIKLHNASFFKKVFYTFYLATYVWRKNQELTADKTNLNKPLIKNPNNCQCFDDQGRPLNDCHNCPR